MNMGYLFFYCWILSVIIFVTFDFKSYFIAHKRYAR